MSGNYLLYPAQKKIFVKFCLCVAKEKLKKNFTEIKEIVECINVDINDGNELQVRDIIKALGLMEYEIKFYLKEKFFPNNWEKLSLSLWDLYL